MRNLTLAAMAAFSLGLAACVPEQPEAPADVPADLEVEGPVNTDQEPRQEPRQEP